MLRVAAVAALAAALLLSLLTACSDGKPKQKDAPSTPAVTAAAIVRTALPAGIAAASPTDSVTSATAAVSNAASTPLLSPTPRTPAAATGVLTPTATDGTAPDPCALVTQTDAEGVLGSAASTRVRNTQLLRQCQYASAAPGNDPEKVVTVQIFPGGAAAWTLRRDTFRQTDPTVQDVAGVGDGAFWVGDQRALFVTSRGVIFDVRVPGSGPTALANAKALALKAVERLH